MSKSQEKYALSTEDYRAEANNRFLRFESEEVQEQYEEGNLTYTNNLKLYLRDVPEGVTDLHDYHLREFAPIIDEFRMTHEEEWQAVQKFRAAVMLSEKEHAQMQNDRDPRAIDYAKLAEEVRVEYIKVLGDAYEILAPMVEQAGLTNRHGELIRPIDLCI